MSEQSFEQLLAVRSQRDRLIEEVAELRKDGES